MLTHLGVFLICLLTDVAAVGWVTTVQRKRMFLAALLSICCTLMGQVTILACVYDHAFIVSSCLGHACGTITAIFLGMVAEKITYG